MLRPIPTVWKNLSAVADALDPLGIVQFHRPEKLSIDILKQLHDPKYVDAFRHRVP